MYIDTYHKSAIMSLLPVTYALLLIPYTSYTKFSACFCWYPLWPWLDGYFVDCALRHEFRRLPRHWVLRGELASASAWSSQMCSHIDDLVCGIGS